VEADIEACFDRIDHVALMGRVRERIADKRVLALIKAFLRAGIMTEHGDLEASLTGTPQGGILSPLLANIALSALDDDFARAWEAMGANSGQRQARRLRGEATYRLVRYADDFVILVAGERRHADALMAHTRRLIEPLGLALARRRPGSCTSTRGSSSSASPSGAAEAATAATSTPTRPSRRSRRSR
jgi:RNA-directed DNA polymerase